MRKTYVIVGPSRTDRDDLRAYSAQRRATKERPVVRIVDSKLFAAEDVAAFVKESEALVFEAWDADIAAAIGDAVDQAFGDNRTDDDMQRGVLLLDEFTDERPVIVLADRASGEPDDFQELEGGPEPDIPQEDGMDQRAPTDIEQMNMDTFAAPAAITLANEEDIDLRDVEGTGKGGRILKTDVDRYLKG